MAYKLKHKKTFNTVYITHCIRYSKDANGMSKGSKKLFVSMCGYGPEGRSSRHRAYKTIDVLKYELSLFWEHPTRIKELDNLEIIHRNDRTGNETIIPMKGIIREIEEGLIMKKLRGI